jgi:replicative DNA helicase
LEQVGGTEYLEALIDSVPTASNALWYAQIVAEKAERRKLIELCHDLIGGAHDHDTSLDALQAKAQQGVIELGKSRSKGEWTTYGDMAHAAFERIEAAQLSEGHVCGIASGLANLDKITMGWADSKLYIIAARPKQGKSMIIQQFAEHAARAGNPVAIFSLEMEKEELGLRAMSGATGYSTDWLRTPRFGEDAWVRMVKAVDDLRIPIYVNDASGLHYIDIMAQARRKVIENGVKLIIVDYLQLVKGDRGESRTREVGIIAQGLKDMAKDLKVPVIALRDSGEIEQNADMVIFVYHNRDKDGAILDSELLISLSRYCAEGTAKVVWRPEKMRFADAADQRVI